jgi:enoyl-CoA hydratase/carnithine racemase
MQQDNAPILVQFIEGIAILTLNRPEARNPISDNDMVDALVDALTRIDADHSIRAIILTGAGSAFSAGGNLKTMGQPGGLGGDGPARTRDQYRRGIQRLPLAFEALEVPVIAAVNGPAIGAGCDLACMCDIRIASERAVFAESFAKVGLVPGDGGAWLLPRIVGFARATEMVLTGDSLTAAEALAANLVSRVVAAEDLLETAMAIARRIAANPADVVRMSRRLMRESYGSQLTSVLEMSAAMQAVAQSTADHREAVSAMLERREPVFQGR